MCGRLRLCARVHVQTYCRHGHFGSRDEPRFLSAGEGVLPTCLFCAAWRGAGGKWLQGATAAAPDGPARRAFQPACRAAASWGPCPGGAPRALPGLGAAGVALGATAGRRCARARVQAPGLPQRGSLPRWRALVPPSRSWRRSTRLPHSPQRWGCGLLRAPARRAPQAVAALLLLPGAPRGAALG